MSCINSNILAGASGSAGGDPVYVDDVFSTFLYEGNGSSKTVVNGIDNTDTALPGLVWIKKRSDAANHFLTHTGATQAPGSGRGDYFTLSTNTSAGLIESPYAITSLTNSGFSVGGNGNTNSGDMVSWNFKSAPGFLDVVTYTGTGSTQNISHSLGSTPGMIFIKSTNTAYNWAVWHRSFSQTGYLRLNSNDAFSASSVAVTAASSTTFTCGGDGETNGNNKTYVAYVFAHDDAQFGTNEDESIIKCGTYSGNGSTTNVNLGFEPQWLLVKSSTAGYNWVMLDNMRGINTGTADDRYVYANTNTEEQAQDMVDLTATGFIAKANANTNANGHTYIYMAIRRPNKPPEAATDVFAIDTAGATSPTPPWFTSGFVTDLVIRKQMNSSQSASIYSRLQGPGFMYAASTSSESSGSNYTWDYMDGFSKITSIDAQIHGYLFKRAPRFMDVVAYEGTGSAQNISHNLGVKPELIIVKNRDSGSSWAVQVGTLTATDRLRLDHTGGTSSITSYWNDTEPTSSVFTVGSDTNTGASYSYIAYLFATLPGISKVGSYTGTGSTLNIDCGFTNGARFVLIKRTDSSGHWYVWDTTRGITNGNDPRFKLNAEAAQQTDEDHIDPLNAGFSIPVSGDVNYSGGNYIFLAIA